MGYTHYWFDRPEVIDNYEDICKDIDQIKDYCAKHRITLLGWDRKKQEYTSEAPLYDADRIAISAPEDEVCETFCMTRKKKLAGGEAFMFCKTARLPYDLAVCLILLRMQATTTGFTFESDGDFDQEDEWQEARRAYEDLFLRRDIKVKETM
ncbi:MAG: hypothetical protein ACYCU8_00930 [Ferrimicrobium acidiphilum]